MNIFPNSFLPKIYKLFINMNGKVCHFFQEEIEYTSVYLYTNILKINLRDQDAIVVSKPDTIISKPETIISKPETIISGFDIRNASRSAHLYNPTAKRLLPISRQKRCRKRRERIRTPAKKWLISVRHLRTICS